MISMLVLGRCHHPFRKRFQKTAHRRERCTHLMRNVGNIVATRLFQSFCLRDVAEQSDGTVNRLLLGQERRNDNLNVAMVFRDNIGSKNNTGSPQ
jgi:hypothetical protein